MEILNNEFTNYLTNIDLNPIIEKLDELILYSDIYVTELVKVRVLSYWILGILIAIFGVMIVILISIYLSKVSK